MKKRLLHTVILTTLLSSLLSLSAFAQDTVGMSPVPALKSAAPLKITPGDYGNIRSLFTYEPSQLTDYAHISGTSISQSAIDAVTNYKSGQISPSDLKAFLSGDDFPGIGYFLSSLSDDQFNDILEEYPFLSDTWSGTPLYTVCMQSFENIDGYNTSISSANREIDTFNMQRKVAYGLTGKQAIITGYDHASYQDALKPIEVYDAYDKCYRRGVMIPNTIMIGNDSGGIYWASSDQIKNPDGTTNMSVPIKNFAISCSAKVVFNYTLYIEDPRCETFQPLVFNACPEKYDISGHDTWAKYDDMFTEGSYMGAYVKEEGKAAVFSSFFINHAAIVLPSFGNEAGCTYIYSIGKDSSAKDTGLTPADLYGVGFGSRGIINTLESTYDKSASWMSLDHAFDHEFYGIFIGNTTTEIRRTVNTSRIEGFWPEDTTFYYGRMTGNSIYTAPHFESNKHIMYATAKDAEKGKMLQILPDRYHPISYDVFWDYDDDYQEINHDYQMSANTVINNTSAITQSQKIIKKTEYYNNYNPVIRGYQETSARYTELYAQITSNITFDLGTSKQIDPIVNTIRVQAHWVEQNPKDTENPIILESNQNFVNLRSLQGEQVRFKRVLDLDKVYRLQLPSIDRPGYTFTGWTDDSGEEYTPGKYYCFRYDKDYHMTAHFTPQHYKVRIFGMQQNGQRSSEPDAEYNCVFDGQNPNIEPLEIPNYHFRSWGTKYQTRIQNMYVYAPVDLSDEAYYDQSSWKWQPLSSEDPLLAFDNSVHHINNKSIHLITEYHAKYAQETILDETTLPQDYRTSTEKWKVYSRLASTWNRVEQGYSPIEIALSVPGSLDHTYTFIDWTHQDPNSIVPTFDGQVIDFYPTYTSNIPDKFQMIYQTEDGQILQRNEINKQTSGTVASVGSSKTGYKPYYLLDGETVNVGDSVLMDSDKILTLQYRPITMKIKLVNAAHSDDTEAPVVKTFDLLYDTPMQIRDILDGLDLQNTSSGSTSQATYLVGLSTDIYDTDALVSGEELSDEAVPKEEFLVNPKYTGSLKDGMVIEIYPVWDIAATYTVRTFMEKDEYENDSDKYELTAAETYNARPSTQITVSPYFFEGYITPMEQTTIIAPNGQTRVDFYYNKEKLPKEEQSQEQSNQPSDMKEALKSAQDFATDLSREINLANMADRAQHILNGETDDDYVSDLTLLKDAFAQESLEKDVLTQALLAIQTSCGSGYEKVIALYNYQNSVSSKTTLKDLLDFEKTADTNIEKYQFSYMAIWYAPAFGQTAMANDFARAAQTVRQRGTTDYHELMELLVSYQEMIEGYEKAVFVTVKHKLVINGEGVVVKEETFASEAGNTFTPVPITDTIQDQVDSTKEKILVLAPEDISTYTLEKDKNLTVELEYGLKDLTESTQPDPETFTMRVKYVARKDGQDTLLDTVDTQVKKNTTFTPSDLTGYEAKIKSLFGNNIVITKPDVSSYAADQNRTITYPYLVTIPTTSYTVTINYKVSYKGQVYDLLTQQKSIPAGSSFTPERFTGDEAVIKSQYGEDIKISLPQVSTFDNVDGNITVNYIYGVSEKGSEQDPEDPKDMVTVSISYKVSVDGQESLIESTNMEAEKGKLLQIPGLKNIEEYVQRNYPGKVITYPQNMTLTPSANASISVIYILSDPDPDGSLIIQHVALLPDGTKRSIGTSTISGYTGNVPMLSVADVKKAFTGQDIEVTLPEVVTYDGKEDKEVVYEYLITFTQNPQSKYYVTYKAVLGEQVAEITTAQISAQVFDNTNVPDPENLSDLIKDIDPRVQVSHTDVKITNMDVVVTYTLEIVHKIKIYHVFVTDTQRLLIGYSNVEGTDTYEAVPFTKEQLETKLERKIASVTIPDATTIDLTKDQDYTFEYRGNFEESSVSENSVDIHISYYGSLDGDKKPIGTADITVLKGRDVQIPDLDGWREKLLKVFGDVTLPEGVDATIRPQDEATDVDYEVVYTVTKKTQNPDIYKVTIHHVSLAKDGTLLPLADTYLSGSKGRTVLAQPLSKEDIDKIFKNVKVESITFPESYSIYLDKDMEKYMYYTLTLESGKEIIVDDGKETDTLTQDTQDKTEPNTPSDDQSKEENSTTVTFKENSDGSVSITDIDTTSTSVTIPSFVEKDGKTYKVKEVSNVLAGSDVKEVQIEDGIEKVSAGAFEGCKKLVSVTIPSSVKTIGDAAFKNTTALKEVTIPEGIKQIGKEVFAGSGIKQIKIPSSVTEIGQKAFAGSALTSVSIPKVKTIGKEAFKGAPLTKVTLGSTKTIGDKAFEGTKIKTITIPKNVTKIGKNAFKNCKKLKTIKIKSKKIKSFGKGAFSGIYKKAKIYLPKSKFAKYKKMLKGKVPKTVKFKKL